MPLKIVRRKSTGALTIDGTLHLSSGPRIRIQQRARSDDPKLAAEEARILEAEILRTDWHGGERGSAKSFAAAVLAYFKAHPEATEATKKRYNRLLRALGNPPASSIGQDTVSELLDRGLLMEARYRQAIKRAEKLSLPPPQRPTPRSGTITREIINPLRAACAMVGLHPEFVIPEEYEGRTVYFMPDEGEAVISQSNHLEPLLRWFRGTGARLGESFQIRWDDRPAPIDLIGRRAILFSDTTKAKKQRIVELTPDVVDALAGLPHRIGPVFRRPDGEPYTLRNDGGCPIKTAHAAAVRRAGLDPKVFTPHVWRHTWATYHYALNKDPLKLMVDGGWSDLKLVKRYAHLMPAGYEDEIRRVLGLCDWRVTTLGRDTGMA
jgi:integrase